MGNVTRKRCALVALAAFLIAFLFAAVSRHMQSQSADAAKADETHLLILMYHGILPDNSRALGDYVVAVSEFESDLRYLQDNGYTSVTMRAVIDHVKNDTPLPPKPVVITFDDGYYNNYVYAFPLLQKYSCTMLLSPIAKWSDFYSEQSTADERYTHVTWDHLREMRDSGVVEIANHSYDLHTLNLGREGSAKKASETTAAYQQVLRVDLERAQIRFLDELGAKPTTYTYPFGAVSKEALAVLKTLGFEAALTCEEKLNTLTNDEACLYRLGRFKRPHGVSSAAFFQHILS